MRHILKILFLYSGISVAQDVAGGAGTASGLLLRFDVNPRISSISGAFTALGDDENALFYNPAALSNFQSGIVSINHTEWFEDIRIENISFGYYLTKNISLGALFTHLWLPQITARDVNGIENGSINVSSSIVQIGAAYRFNSQISAGLALKYLNDKLGEYSASAFSADVGLHFKFIRNRLLAGLAVQNLGTKLKYDIDEQQLPMTFRGGLAYRIIDPDISLTSDVVKSTDTDVTILAGVEYILLKQIAFRAGARYVTKNEITPSFGIGFNVKQQYYLNYAFMTYSDLGGTHRLGFTYHSDTPASRRKPQTYELASIVVLKPPDEVSVEIDDNKLLLRWNRVPGVLYNVYAKHSSQIKWIKINKSPLYNNSIIFKKPRAKGKLFFRVSSIHNARESKFSKETIINVE